MPLEPPPQGRQKRNGIPFTKEVTVGSDEGRRGALYWRPVSHITEITLYPLLWGQTLLVFGRRDKDAWQTGYYYPDHQSGWRAAEEWDGSGDPGYGWVKKVSWDEKRMEEEAL
jgi:hypothetical protein